MKIVDWMWNRKGAVLAWGLLAVVAALIVVFARIKKPEEDVSVEKERPVAVRVVEMAPRRVPDVIQLPARIDPVQAAQLPAERAGQVVERLVDKGDVVEAGQVLLRVDNRLWDAAHRRAAIEARDAAKDLARWKELEKTGAVSASDYEAIVRRQEAAEIALQETQVFLDQCEVRAPFAGIIVDRFVDLGDYANEGQAVLRLVRLDRVKVAFDVPEQDIVSVEPGQEKPFTLAALPGREFGGTVSFVSSQAARESNSFTVELEADNADGALKAGMIAQVSLLRRMREAAVVVPLAAVVPRKGEHYVFVVADGRAVRRRVLIGAMLGHEAVLDGGVAVGDRVVVEGHRGLQDGMAVTVFDALPEE
jgi:membrane fusion protein, multidrug efflux system